MAQRVDNESAREILAARMAEQAAPAAPGADSASHARQSAAQRSQAASPHQQPAAQHQGGAAGTLEGGMAAMTTFLQSRQGKQLQKEVVRGVFGLLKRKM